MARSVGNYQVTVTSSTVMIAHFARDRIAMFIRNDSGNTVYIGHDPTNVNAEGASLPTGTSRTWYKKWGDSCNRPFYGYAANNSVICVEETIDDDPAWSKY
jgi:hypothetical protein